MASDYDKAAKNVERLKAKFWELAAKGGKGYEVDPEVWWAQGQLLAQIRHIMFMRGYSQAWAKEELGISAMQAWRLRWIGGLPRPPKKGTTLAQAVVLGKAHYNSPKEKAKRAAQLAEWEAAFRAMKR